VRVDPQSILDRQRTPVQLEVAREVMPIGERRMDDDPRVPLEIARLRRLPHHPEHQLVADELRLDR
jgi:hypothetical protein